MNSNEPDKNFNREIEKLLEKAGQRVGQLKELRRGELSPWEKERIFRGLERLETGEYTSRRRLKQKLQDLEAEIKRLYSEFAFVSFFALLLCILFSWMLWIVW